MVETYLSAQRMNSSDNTWRIWLDDSENFAAHGFGPNTKVVVSFDSDVVKIRIGSTVSSTHALDSDPDNLFLDIMLPQTWVVTEGHTFRLNWSPGTIQITKLPPLPDAGFRIQELGRLIQFVDFGVSSNSKFSKVHDGEFWSPSSYLAALFGINEADVYLTATSSKVTNLRKQLLQSTQHNCSVGVAIYRGDDWTPKLVEKYLYDDALLDAYEDGFIFIVQEPGDYSAIFIEGIAYNYGKRPRFKRIREESYHLERERDSVGKFEDKVVVWDMELLAAASLLPNMQNLEQMSDKEVSARLISLSNQIRIEREG